ncbi:MAG: thioredoxin domain-containing protein, partial [Proteobacteria bacterium]
DSRPDLAARYEDYGWPATIIFTPDGKEIVKKSGYITPVAMAELLRKVAKDPSPLPDEDLKHPEVLNPALSEELKKKFEADIQDRYDQKQGSWDVSHKFIDANFAELYLNKSLYGDKKAAKWLKQTLDNNLKIHDPVWGGVYQYSTGGVWNEAHFEKIMSIQADNIRIYAQAGLVFKNKKYLEAAKKTANYINEFLTSPEGGFYTSQDADLVQGQHSESFFKLGDKARRKQGIPRVDKNRYARENGWMIQALAALYAATGEKVYLERAEKAAKWIQENRSLHGGGFRHAEKDLAGPYLSDTSTMGSAFLRLYLVTGNRAYYSASVEAAKFIDQNFKNAKAGFDAAV